MSQADSSQMTELGLRFAKAAQARDTDALVEMYHPDARFWNNILGHESGTAEVAELTRLEARVITSYVFEDLRCTPTEKGFVLQMQVTGQTRSDATFAVATCLVAQVDGTLISRIDEYVDATQAAPIFSELLAGHTGGQA